MSAARRSLLQTQILAQLAREPALSVTALAETISASRSSVSRSLGGLKDRALVVQRDRTWLVTEKGRAEAEEAEAKLRDSTEEVVELAGRKFKALSRLGLEHSIPAGLVSGFLPKTASQISDLGISYQDISASMSQNLELLDRSVTNSGMAAASLADHSLTDFAGSAAALVGESNLGKAGLATEISGLTEDWDSLQSATVQDPIGTIGVSAGSAVTKNAVEGIIDPLPMTALGRISEFDSVHSMLSSSLAFDISDVASPLIDAQKQYSSFLSQVSTQQAGLYYARVAEQSSLLNGALNDVVGIQHAEASLIAERPDILAGLTWVPDQLTEVATSFADVFSAELDRYSLEEQVISVSSLAERLAVATAPMTHFTSAVRYLVEAEVEPQGPLLPQTGRIDHDRGNVRLDPMLRRIDPDFPDMRQGAWLALASDNPDRLRHAATSQRELLTQLLRRIVPDFAITDDEQQGSKIRGRVKEALGGSNSKSHFVMDIAVAVYSYYSNLSKYTHTNQKHEDSLRAMLTAGEGLIEFIVVNIDVTGDL